MNYYVNIEFPPGIDKLDTAEVFVRAAEAGQKIGHPVSAYYDDQYYFVNLDGTGEKSDSEGKILGEWDGDTYRPYFPGKPEPPAEPCLDEPAQEPWWMTAVTVFGFVVIFAALLWFAVRHFPFPKAPETVTYAASGIQGEIDHWQRVLDARRQALAWAKTQGLAPTSVDCVSNTKCTVEAPGETWALACDSDGPASSWAAKSLAGFRSTAARR